MSSDTVSSTPSTPPSGSSAPSDNSPRRSPWRYWALGVAAILVALGTATLVAIQAPQPASPSRSALALRAAHDDALRLASLAHNAAERGGTSPGTQAALSAAGTILARQAAVLGGTPLQATPGAASPTGPAQVGTVPVGTAPVGTAPVGTAPVGTAPVGTAPVGTAPVGTAPVGTATAGTATAGTATPTTASAGAASTGAGSAGAGTTQASDVATALAASVQARLSALSDVDAPTATLLASVAAGQSVELDAIAAATGATAGALPSAPPSGTTSPSAGTGTAASPSASTSTAASPSASTSTAASPSASGSCPSPTATASYDGTGFAGALAATERAETAAAYLLETAVARTPAGSPDAAARSSALDAHRHQLASVESLASAACTALPPRDAGFAVPPNFASDPSTALKAVEGSCEEAWAQLVGQSPAARRATAAGGLATAARLAVTASPSNAAAFPGVPTAN